MVVNRKRMNVMKRYIKVIFILTALASVLSSCHKKMYVDYSPWYKSDADEDGRRQIAVMSFNVRFGSSSDDTGNRDWSVRKNGVSAMLTQKHPLLMGTQECEPEQRKDIIAANPEYAAVGIDLHGPTEECEQVAIFYLKDSIEIVRHGTFYLSATPDVPSRLPQSNHYRVCTWIQARLKKGGQEFFHFNTHLDTQTAAQPTEMAVILDRIKMYNTDGLPMFLTGDFNCEESSSVHDDIKKYGFKSARIDALIGDSYKTYNAYGDNSGSAIDHCFYKDFYSVPSFVTVRDKYAGLTYISDHYPISITLKFR